MNDCKNLGNQIQFMKKLSQVIYDEKKRSHNETFIAKHRKFARKKWEKMKAKKSKNSNQEKPRKNFGGQKHREFKQKHRVSFKLGHLSFGI